MHPDIVSAIDEVLAKQSDQTDEFKKRVRKMIDNVVTVGRVKDSDVKEVLDLVAVPNETETAT